MEQLAAEKTMTTAELAEVLGVDTTTIQKTVLKLAEVLPPVLKNNQGGYLFNEHQATLIKCEIQKHHNLDCRQIDTVTTDAEMELMTQKVIAYHQQKAMEYKRRAEQAETKLITESSYIAFAHSVTDSKDAIDIGAAAKVLNKNIGRNKLFELLREKKVLDGSNVPYQKYIDCGYFRVIESKYVTPNGTIKINLKTVVFQKGIKYINSLLEG